MADLDKINRSVVGPGLELLPSYMDTMDARQQLLTTGLQESGFRNRKQIGGPAVSFWQAEKAGGIAEVLENAKTAGFAKSVCAERGVKAARDAVYVALQSDDLLGCAFARLILWPDPAPIPAAGYSGAAFEYYLRNWRPGAYTRGTSDDRTALRKRWESNYQSVYEVLHA